MLANDAGEYADVSVIIRHYITAANWPRPESDPRPLSAERYIDLSLCRELGMVCLYLDVHIGR